MFNMDKRMIYSVIITLESGEDVVYEVKAENAENAKKAALKKHRILKRLSLAGSEMKSSLLYRPKFGFKSTFASLLPWKNRNLAEAGKSINGFGNYKPGSFLRELVLSIAKGKSVVNESILDKEALNSAIKYKYTELAIYTLMALVGIVYFYLGLLNITNSNIFYIRLLNPYLIAGIGLASVGSIHGYIAFRDIYRLATRLHEISNE
jgi:hypothetical protein